MCEPQLRTPSIWRRSWQAETEIRVSSPTEVPGWVSQCIKKSRSLKLGNSWLPSVGTASTPTSSITPVVTRAGSGRRISRAITTW